MCGAGGFGKECGHEIDLLGVHPAACLGLVVWSLCTRFWRCGGAHGFGHGRFLWERGVSKSKKESKVRRAPLNPSRSIPGALKSIRTGLNSCAKWLAAVRVASRSIEAGSRVGLELGAAAVEPSRIEKTREARRSRQSRCASLEASRQAVQSRGKAPHARRLFDSSIPPPRCDWSAALRYSVGGGSVAALHILPAIAGSSCHRSRWWCQLMLEGRGGRHPSIRQTRHEKPAAK